MEVVKIPFEHHSLKTHGHQNAVRLEKKNRNLFSIFCRYTNQAQAYSSELGGKEQQGSDCFRRSPWESPMRIEETEAAIQKIQSLLEPQLQQTEATELLPGATGSLTMRIGYFKSGRQLLAKKYPWISAVLFQGSYLKTH